MGGEHELKRLRSLAGCLGLLESDEISQRVASYGVAACFEDIRRNLLNRIFKTGDTGGITDTLE
jgi:hypothetical protein